MSQTMTIHLTTKVFWNVAFLIKTGAGTANTVASNDPHAPSTHSIPISTPDHQQLVHTNRTIPVCVSEEHMQAYIVRSMPVAVESLTGMQVRVRLVCYLPCSASFLFPDDHGVIKATAGK